MIDFEQTLYWMVLMAAVERNRVPADLDYSKTILNAHGVWVQAVYPEEYAAVHGEKRETLS